MYTPPFTISAKAIHLIAEISAQIERYAIRMEQEDALLLRKVNRIKSIHSSLAIEGNKLTEDEVIDILDGKTVVAPLREIQEVKNAIKTYNAYASLDPYSVDDLLRAHRLMMEALTDDAGRFRRGGVGVYAGSQLLHIAPPADRVPYLIKDLMDWLRESEDHLLIKSCVLHYEFEFIHPFSDGNGRTGRLWQSLILGKLHPLFEHLPIENMVYANQQAYYDAIERSSDKGDSGAFIDFMLAEILNALKSRQGKVLPDDTVNDTVSDTVKCIKANPKVTLDDLVVHLGKSRSTVARIIRQLREKGVIRRVGSDKTGYWEIL